MRRKVFIFLFLISLLLCLYLFVNYLIIEENNTRKFLLLRENIEELVKEFPGRVGIVIKDLSGKNWKIAINEDTIFPAASVIKLPIACAVLMAINEGILSPDKDYILRDKFKTPGSGILKNLPQGRSFSLQELLEYMISYSDNTATNMIIDILGYRRINNYFKNLNLKNTTLKRKMMDFSARRRGFKNLSNCQDISYLLEEIYRKHFLSYVSSSQILSLLLRQRLRDRLPRDLPKSIPVAHKTGLEKGVVHDAGIVFTPRGDYLICVFTEGVKNYRKAKEFIAQICRRVFDYY